MYMTEDALILVLDVTKRGIEQKVVITDGSVRAWMASYIKLCGGQKGARVFLSPIAEWHGSCGALLRD